MRKKISHQICSVLLAILMPFSAFGQGVYFARPAASGGTHPTLNTDLIAYWDLDEASGSRTDSETTGTAQNLTDVNTVTSAGGKLSNAGQFVLANSERLSRSDSADLSVGTGVSFSIAAWAYMDSKAATMYVVSKAVTTSSGTTEYVLGYFPAATDRFFFRTGIPSSGTLNTVLANNFGAPSTATWYLIVGVYDSSAGTIKVSVNGGTQDSTGSVVDPPDTASEFNIGSSATPNAWWDGRIDEVGFWKKALTTSEITDLYNSGAGLTYPF